MHALHGWMSSLSTAPLFPTVCLKAAEFKVNFGATPFTFPPPAAEGFAPFAELKPEHLGSEAENAKIREQAKGGGGAKSKQKTPLAIVIAPTKELVRILNLQVVWFGHFGDMHGWYCWRVCYLEFGIWHCNIWHCSVAALQHSRWHLVFC